MLALAGGLLLSRSSAPVDFNAEIRPILNDRCITCHGGVRQAGGFSVLFREEALDTTEAGVYAIVPGDPDASELLRRVTHPDADERMPPEGPPLADDEVAALRRWIEQGAEWADHWAYVAPQPQALPDVSDPAWGKTDLDRFVRARLDAEGLAPSPEADCATLLRRVALDLTGLPPTPEQTDAFCANPSDAAYAQVVDSLLASPHFGERWAAMWLDLARYADTKGYERDAARSIWRYRDWVVDAFNRDLPFDRFTIEQLAGDLLPGATDAQVLATAFHRNTTTNDEGGTDDEEFRVAAVIDRVNTTFEVWQGTTFGCVQCHSHPYDPFRQVDYYRVYAFFNNTEDADRFDEYPVLRTYDRTDEAEVQALLQRIEAINRTDTTALPSLSERVHRALYPDPAHRIVPSHFDGRRAINVESEFAIAQEPGAYLRFDGVDLTGIASVTYEFYGGREDATLEIRLGAPDGPRISRAAILPGDGGPRAVRVPVRPTPGVHDAFFVFNEGGRAGGFRLHTIYLHPERSDLPPAVRRQLLAAQQALAALPADRTPILRERPAHIRRITHVFNRGNWLDPAEAVEPDVPSSLPPLPEGAPRNRLGLAQWLVSPANPLTARVTVNRFWQQLFGTGLVETLEDFGTQGERPSHPALLDHLALRFMHVHGWRVKALLREIVLSATYRQASQASPELIERDPQNRLLARGPRVRLTAEQVRDQGLAVSGLLSDKRGGPSVMPPQPEGIWNSPYNGEQWIASEGEDRYRRALYTYWKRSSPYPSLLAFDAPMRDVCVSRRIPTNTPLQALVTLNDPVYVEAAQALARRMRAEGGDSVDGRLQRGYRLVLMRPPDAATLAELRGLYADALTHFRADEAARVRFFQTAAYPDASAAGPEAEDAALAVVANALLNLDAVLMK